MKIMSLWEQSGPMFVFDGRSSGQFNGGVQNRAWSEMAESHDVNSVHTSSANLNPQQPETTVEEQAKIPYSQRNDTHRETHPLTWPYMRRRKHGTEELYADSTRFEGRSLYYKQSTSGQDRGRQAVRRWEFLAGVKNTREIPEMDGSI